MVTEFESRLVGSFAQHNGYIGLAAALNVSLMLFEFAYFPKPVNLRVKSQNEGIRRAENPLNDSLRQAFDRAHKVVNEVSHNEYVAAGGYAIAKIVFIRNGFLKPIFRLTAWIELDTRDVTFMSPVFGEGLTSD